MLEASAGEEAGIKSASFIGQGRERLRLYSAEKGVHRLVRISPFDAQARRHTAFAPVRGLAGRRRGRSTSRSTRTTCRIDTYRASGAGGQHVNKTDSGGAHHAHPDGHRRAVPERALAVVEQGDRDEDAASRSCSSARSSARREEIAKEKGEAQDVGWGSQIRSYVMQPYTMVKDHRTNTEVGDINRVLDGDLDPFVRAELLRRAGSAGNGADQN